jgi:O-acetyl-ADP-ribose deacetylase (regulator of RNase III)
MISIHIDSATIECVEGDIAEQNTDAIVNAANNELWMESGVAGAIKRRGGVEIEHEAIAKGPIEPGEVIETTAGRLSAKYVIHAAGMGPDFVTNAGLIRDTTRASLKLADKLGCRSISFPSIGTGVGHFAMDACAKIMVAEAVAFLPEAVSLNVVRFVLYGDKAYRAFATEFVRHDR